MASPVPPTSPEPIPAPSSTPPTSTDGAGAGQAAAPAPWRAPDTAPPEFRGKTPEEILGIATTLYGVAQRFNQQGVVAGQPAPPPQAPSPSYQPIQDDDFVTGGAVRQYVQQAAQTFQPALQQTLQQTAAMAVAFARQQHADAFQKFGPEIEAELARVPLEMRNLDNIGTIVDIVRGRHWRELAEEEGRKIAATIAPTLRSNGNGSPGSGGPSVPSLTLQTEAVPEEWRRKALATGLDDAAIAEFCRAQGWTTKQFYDQFSKGQIQAAVSDTPVNRLVQQRGM